MAPLRFRPDWDILHLKNFDFVFGEKDFSGSGFHGTGHWESEPSDTELVAPPDKLLELCSMAHLFKNVKVLSINRETYVSSRQDASDIFQYYFPNLVLLIILIDDDIDVLSSRHLSFPCFSTL